jgi:hypothetical protein
MIIFSIKWRKKTRFLTFRDEKRLQATALRRNLPPPGCVRRASQLIVLSCESVDSFIVRVS